MEGVREGGREGGRARTYMGALLVGESSNDLPQGREGLVDGLGFF
jgi:hypothetical protein